MDVLGCLSSQEITCLSGIRLISAESTLVSRIIINRRTGA